MFLPLRRLRIGIIRDGPRGPGGKIEGPGAIETIWDWRRSSVPAPLPLDCSAGLTEYHAARKFATSSEFYAGLPSDDNAVKKLLKNWQGPMSGGPVESRMCCVRLELEDFAFGQHALGARGTPTRLGGLAEDSAGAMDEPALKRAKVSVVSGAAERLLPADDPVVVQKTGAENNDGAGAPQHSPNVPRKLVFLQTLFFDGSAPALKRALDHRDATSYALLPVGGVAIPISIDLFERGKDEGVCPQRKT